jgi:FAS-associated factor 2
MLHNTPHKFGVATVGVLSFTIGVGLGAAVTLYFQRKSQNKMERRRETPVLDEVKNGLLATYQAATGEEDTMKGIQALEQHQWDLQAAVEATLNRRTNSTASTDTRSPSSWSLYGIASSLLGYLVGSGATTHQNGFAGMLSDYSADGIHPRIVPGTYQDACNAAKQQFKFLIIYLHSTMHQDTDHFCREVLCTELIADFFNEHFLFWGGSISMADGYRLSTLLDASSYPFLAVICNNTIGGVTIIDRIEGKISCEDLITRLTNILDTRGNILLEARVDYEERERDRLLRAEQDEAFQQSLAQDQEKERKLREERERLEEEEQKKRQIEEEKNHQLQNREKRRKSLAATLPPEPHQNDKNSTQLVIRLLDGSRLQRRFGNGDLVQTVFNYVDAHGNLDCDEYELVTNFPRKIFSPENNGKFTLEEAGLTPQASLFVQEK